MSDYKLLLILTKINPDNEYIDDGVVSIDARKLSGDKIKKLLREVTKLIREREMQEQSDE